MLVTPHHMLHSIPGAVFSVSLHPSSELVCSGGEDDKAYLWRVGDGVVVHECQGTGQWVIETNGGH